MHLLSAITALAAVASTTAHAFVPADFSAMLGALSVVNNNAGNTVNDGPPSPAPPMVCWKNLHSRSLVSTSEAACPAGTERQGNACYTLCGKNFIGFGPYCMPERSYAADVGQTTLVFVAKLSYRRDVTVPTSVEHTCEKDGLCYATCPASTEALGSVCTQSECPSTLPFSCGLACSKTRQECTKEISRVTITVLQLVKAANSQNWPEVVMQVKILFGLLKDIPVCDSLASSSSSSSPSVATAMFGESVSAEQRDAEAVMKILSYFQGLAQ